MAAQVRGRPYPEPISKPGPIHFRKALGQKIAPVILQNIPQELRMLPHWVAAGTDKLPLNPRTGQPASVTDPSTWGTFEEAHNTGFKHIGYVLSKDDNYSIVDLDDPTTIKVNGVVMPNPDLEQVARITERHKRILAAFETYAETSQSGTGVHIICQGRIPHGVRRDKVEVYSDGRYMICTGSTVKNLPITDQQTLLTALFEEISQGALATTELKQIDGHLTDDQVYQMASTAANAEKFLMLWQGNWQGRPEYPSQSEADFALLAMLGFYSEDNEQVRRIFRWSALGHREKATRNDKYLNFALSKIRAKTPPPVDFSALLARGSAIVPQIQTKPPVKQTNAQPIQTLLPATVVENHTWNEADPEGEEVSLRSEAKGRDLSYPPGFVGQLAEYIFSSAIRPVPEIALCASIALTAGVVGRSFNISGTGLNQYLILLAKTGSGKEGAATGIDAMVNAVRPQVPMIDEFLGPGAFASGQALIRVLDRNPCFVSVLGEFGLTLQQMCSPNANGAQVMLKKVLLDIYAKSGWQKMLASSVYSDSEKNTKKIQAPNVTIFGESNPEKFYEGLDAGIIAEGLLPRFSIFEYTGPRPDTNPNAFHPPPDALVRYFGGLAAVAMAAQQNRVCSPVQQDREAVGLLRGFDVHATAQINSSGADVTKQLWNRAHLKALKMSALIAVGCNPHQPIITKQIADWSIALVCRDIQKLLVKFESGEVGNGDVRLELDVRRAVTDYLAFSEWDRQAYGCPAKMAALPLVPLQYLRRRLRLLVNFKNDRRGANAALKATLDAMVEGEVLTRISPLQARDQCGTTSPVYAIGQAWQN